MKSKTHTDEISGGYAALIAVVMLSAGTVAFSMATMSAALWYADGVDRRELRIQARLNAEACLDTAAIMVAKDNFLDGRVNVRELGCVIGAENDMAGSVSLDITANLEGVSVSMDGVAAY